MVNAILAIYLHDHLSASLVEIGVIVSAFFIASAISKLFIGFAFSDWPTYVVITSFCVMSLTSFTYTIANSVALMILLRLIHGFSWGMYLVAALTLTTTLVSKVDQSASVVYFTSATALGLAFGPAMGAITLAFLSIKKVFLMSSIITFAGFFITLSLRKKKPMSSEMSIYNISRDLINPRIIISDIAWFGYGWVYGVLFAYTPILGRNSYFLSESNISSLFFLYFFSVLAIRLILGKLVINKVYVKLIAISLTIASIALFPLSATSYFQFFISGFVLLGIAHGLLFPAVLILIAKTSSSEHRMLTNATCLISFDLGSVFSPLLLSAFAQNYGVPFVLQVSSIIPFMGLVFVFFIYSLKGSENVL